MLWEKNGCDTALLSKGVVGGEERGQRLHTGSKMTSQADVYGLLVIIL